MNRWKIEFIITDDYKNVGESPFTENEWKNIISNFVKLPGISLESIKVYLENKKGEKQ